MFSARPTIALNDWAVSLGPNLKYNKKVVDYPSNSLATIAAVEKYKPAQCIVVKWNKDNKAEKVDSRELEYSPHCAVRCAILNEYISFIFSYLK